MFDKLPYKSKYVSVDYPEVVDVYELDENGEIICTGTHNIQEEIDSYAAEVDINNIIKRCLDPRSLSVIGKSTFEDGTIIQDNMNDAINDINAKFTNAIAIYDSLTPEQKAHFSSLADFLKNYEIVYNQNPINEQPKETAQEGDK